MNKPIYLIRVAFQTIMIAGIYFLYCSNPDGSFTLRIGLVLAGLILSWICQIYLMKFRGLRPVSQETARQKGDHINEVNFFLVIALLLAYDFFGQIVAVGFYLWDKRINASV